MVFNPSPMVALVSALQPAKAEPPIDVTLLGMLTEVSFVHPLNDEFAMTTQPSWIVSVVIPVQFSNTPVSIDSSTALSVTFVKRVHALNA